MIHELRRDVSCAECKKPRVIVWRMKHTGMDFCWRCWWPLFAWWMLGSPYEGEVENRRLGRLIGLYYRLRWPDEQRRVEQ